MANNYAFIDNGKRIAVLLCGIQEKDMKIIITVFLKVNVRQGVRMYTKGK